MRKKITFMVSCFTIFSLDWLSIYTESRASAGFKLQRVETRYLNKLYAKAPSKMGPRGGKRTAILPSRINRVRFSDLREKIHHMKVTTCYLELSKILVNT